MISAGVLLLIVLLPVAAAVVCLRLARALPERALRISAAAAVLLALLASVAAVGAEIVLPANRALALTAIGQFGIELLALAMLGMVLALFREPGELIARWLPVSWLCLAGLVVALLIRSMTLASLLFLVATLLWVFGLPPEQRAANSSVMVRYMAFVALALPLLLAGFRVAEARTAAAPGLEALALAFLVPGFGLLLGLIPLHGWTLTLAAGAPRAMLFGVLALVQTAGFLLLLRALQAYPWLVSDARELLVLGGALSALVGGWLALSARRDDPDDWLVYAVVASSGVALVGLGSQTLVAAVGVLFLLVARVFALVLVAMAPRAGSWRLERLANGVGTLALAGTPWLAGFPALWLVLHPLHGAAAPAAQLAVLTGGACLFATAVRRWPTEPPAAEGEASATEQPHRAIYLLVAVLMVMGVLPALFIPAIYDVLRELFLLP
jgi:formate hydrogenlyase subunit 3/multisubunit Na+/H+ antiporter MnhD subunit